MRPAGAAFAVAALAAFVLAGCASREAGPETSPAAGTDAGTDAGPGTSADSGPDASPDVGTAGARPAVEQADARPPDPGAGQPIPGGDFRDSLVHDGVERTYDLHVPPGLLTNQSVPLLVVLHPALANGGAVHAVYGFDAYADENGFILAYPDGTSEPGEPDQRTWNAVHCCGIAHSTGVDDVGFVAQLIAKLRRDYPIDATHIGLAGHSNGAMLAHRFAAEHSALVSSVTAVAGTIGGQEDRFSERLQVPAPAAPLSVQIIHAYDDPIVTYYGGPNHGTYERFRLDIPVRETTEFWRGHAGAAEQTGNWSSDGVDYETYMAPDGTEVVLASTHGGHGWPGSGQAIPKIVKVPPAPDATALAVAFFLRH